MKNSSIRPRPVAVKRILNVSFLEQEGFNGLRSGNESASLTEFMGAFHDHVGDVCHRFGLHLEHGTVYLRGERVVVFLDLAAGEWRTVVTYRGRRDKNPIGRLCSKILRLANAKNEQLG